MRPRDFRDILGVLSGFLGQRPGAPEVIAQLQEYLASVVYNAPTKWGSRRRSLFEPTRCTAHPSCRTPAVHYCSVCNQDVCTVHCYVNTDADVVCNVCVQTARRARTAPPPGQSYGAWDDPFDPRRDVPPPGWHPGGRRGRPRPAPGPEEQRRREALKVLGLKLSASWDEIHEKFRELSVKHHPDRHPKATPSRRARLEQKFKAISEAYHYLERTRRAA